MRAILLAIAIALIDANHASAQPTADAKARLGPVHFATSCSPAVQPLFNTAVTELHSFAFPAAISHFSAVLQQDPKCAIAEWGIALSEWGNPFVAGAKSAAQLQRGLAAVQRARNIGAAIPRERDYINAIARLYEHTDSLGQRQRVLAYRDALAALSASAPTDTEAMIFHALAQAEATDPTDKTYTQQLAAGATLERLFAVMPDHPGLAHYIIHAYDVPALAKRGVAAANRYAAIAPDVSHALHMPSHIYTRLGTWQASITANRAAAAAASREGATAQQLHASDYQVYAYLQLGQFRSAQRIVSEVPGIAAQLDPTRLATGAPPAAGFYAIAAIPARYALERGDWAAASIMTEITGPNPQANAMTQFARALGAARIRDTALARRALAELERLRDTLTALREPYWREQVEIQRLAATAWLQLAVDKPDDALVTMRSAADREDATEKDVVSPGPLAPARELLGEMLLALHQPVAALAAFESTLKREPNRRRALAGAAAAADAGRNEDARVSYRRQLRSLCVHADPVVTAGARTTKACAAPLL